MKEIKEIKEIKDLIYKINHAKYNYLKIWLTKEMSDVIMYNEKTKDEIIIERNKNKIQIKIGIQFINEPIKQIDDIVKTVTQIYYTISKNIPYKKLELLYKTEHQRKYFYKNLAICSTKHKYKDYFYNITIHNYAGLLNPSWYKNNVNFVDISENIWQKLY